MEVHVRDTDTSELTERPFVEILGVRINLVDYDTTVALMKERILHYSWGRYICASPVFPIMVAQKDSALRDALNHSWLTVPDGMPVVWAARALGVAIRDRVYGPELMLRSCGMAEEFGYSIFLYGGKPETLKRLEVTLRDRYPHLGIAGSYAPPFRQLSSDEDARIVEMINSASPHILFVGLGAPKQEKWMAAHCKRLRIPVTLGVGAAFDFLSGEKKQAPVWMQAHGLEWLFRLWSEPARLWSRYLVYNPLFLVLFLRQLVAAKSNERNRNRGHSGNHRTKRCIVKGPLGK